MYLTEDLSNVKIYKFSCIHQFSIKLQCVRSRKYLGADLKEK